MRNPIFWTVDEPWYADNSAMGGPASRILEAVKLLQQWGPSRGYFAEPAKSIVICDDDAATPRVKAILAELPVHYCQGHRYVGGFIGHANSRREWIAPQIQKWTRAVQTLAVIARKYPQTAYAGLQQSLQSEWQYAVGDEHWTEKCFNP